MGGENIKRTDFIYLAGLAIIALWVFPYIFSARLDINGDNCHYYINATSLSQGKGYCDMFGKATANFPPGYPMLMAPLRCITASIVAQKVLNLLLFFGSTVMLYFLLIRQDLPKTLAFIISAAVLTTPHLLEFATMMMSESSCIFFIILSLLLFCFLPDERKGERIWSSKCLYLFLAATLFSFYIRTQAVVLAGAFIAGLAAVRRWRLSVAVTLVSVLGYLPWVIRNALYGLGQSRYVSQISLDSFGTKIKMLIVQALPESMAPYFNVDYMRSPSLLLWVVAIGILAVSAYGIWRLERLRAVVYPFLVFGVGMIAAINTPSLYRYLIILLPVFTAVFFTGLWMIADRLSTRLFKRNFSPWFMVLLLIPGVSCGGNGIMKHNLKDLNSFSKHEYPPHFINYFSMAHAALVAEPDAIIASRKPELLYVAEGVKGVQFKKTTDEVEFVRHLLLEGVGYVIVDDTGFSSTDNYLVQFISNNKELFTIKDYTPQPHTFLFRFEREIARKWLKRKGY